MGNAVKSQRTAKFRSRWRGIERREQLSLHFAVRDTGIGIPLEQQESSSTPFRKLMDRPRENTAGPGSGSRFHSRLVEMMHGRIWVESEPDQGSCFHFTALWASLRM